MSVFEDMMMSRIFGLDREELKVKRKETRIKYNRGYQISVGEMSGVCGTQDAYEICL
jgi:hypothetical protein